MPKLTYLLSLPTDDNDYQQEQATAAKETATRLGFDLRVVYAANDAIKQSDQILQAIQSPAGARPDAILFEPLGATALPQVPSSHDAGPFRTRPCQLRSADIRMFDVRARAAG